MQARIRNWVRSLAVRICKLVVAPAPGAYDLDDLLGKVTPDNVHRETGTGTPQGREVW